MINKHNALLSDIRDILQQARQKAYAAVNFAMVEAYWLIGKRIVDEDQQGKTRAAYGKGILRQLAEKLTREFGKGFEERELRRMRQFYLCFPIRDAVRPELSWTHYRLLLRVEKEKARSYYLNEALEQNWSSRALERQIHSLYYDRMRKSRDKGIVIEEMQDKVIPHTAAPEDFIKDPYVLEFLNIPDQHTFRELELEQAIIEKLREFILELGRGFAFVSRQQRISTETSEFFIDLVFYNYILKCFVLIDLKTGKLTHQDIGQMDMYVRLYEDTRKGEDDNPTIGIILCTEKDHTVVKYSVLSENRRLFASKYQLYLPTEEELAREIEREKALLVKETTKSRKAVLAGQKAKSRKRH